MPTFAGSYIKEPADLASVCTERDIIACSDDPGGVDLRNVQTFVDLAGVGGGTAAVVAVMNPLIANVERLVERYAARAGYAVPLSPIDGELTSIIARRLWIDMRQRAKSLTAQAAEQQRTDFRKGDLAELVKGTLVLSAARVANGKSAPSAQVHSFNDAASRDTDGDVVRMSRKSLRGF